MIYTYGITEQGAYHVKKNIVCQDAHKIIKICNDLVIAAVADGLGSEEHSDIASKIAVEISTTHCADNIKEISGKDDMLKLINTSFSLALDSIEQAAKNNGHSIDQYDTTLTLAIMQNDTLFYGHSGDSGIVALTTEGLYEKVTEQQRDEDNRVFPLYFKDKWIFGQFNKKVSGVFLATDGMLEPLFPIYIRNEPINIYVALAGFFLDNRILQIDKTGENEVQSRIKEFICNIPEEQVNDDKTVVVLVNTSVQTALQPDEYYKEPNWEELKRKRDEEWKRQAYPHLFKDTTQTETITDEVIVNEEDVNKTNNSNYINVFLKKYRIYFFLFFLFFVGVLSCFLFFSKRNTQRSLNYEVEKQPIEEQQVITDTEISNNP